MFRVAPTEEIRCSASAPSPGSAAVFAGPRPCIHCSRYDEPWTVRCRLVPLRLPVLARVQGRSLTNIWHCFRLLLDLFELQPEVWKDYIGFVEQEICVRAAGFVGSWPSTYSLLIYNRRLALQKSSGASDVRFFRKLARNCLDDAPMAQFPHTQRLMAALQDRQKFRLGSQNRREC